MCLYTALGCTLKNSRPLDPERRKKQTSQAGGNQALSPTASRSGPTFCKYTALHQLSPLTAQRTHFTGSVAADGFCSVNISKFQEKRPCGYDTAAPAGSPRDQRIQRVCSYSRCASQERMNKSVVPTLPKVSSSFPARALPALGATNSEKQRDTDLHVAKAIGNTLFCLLECSMTQILPVSPSPDVGEGWSLLIISWSRNVHPNSQARVSALQQ